MSRRYLATLAPLAISGFLMLWVAASKVQSLVGGRLAEAAPAQQVLYWAISVAEVVLVISLLSPRLRTLGASIACAGFLGASLARLSVSLSGSLRVGCGCVGDRQVSHAEALLIAATIAAGAASYLLVTEGRFTARLPG